MDLKKIQSRVQISTDTAIRFLASDRCFRIIVGLFIIQALWLVFSARYPMPFDEDFHFRLIQLHANQWLPFFTSQPAHAEAYGAVVRDPSYLYHYLMSIPYRLISIFTNNETIQVILLRIINVGLSVYSLVLFRRLLLRLGGSRALTHISLFLFSLVPIVPLLAAQINYDNLLIPLTTWVLLAAINWFEGLSEGRISFAKTTLLISIMMLASIVKYTFLPIAVGVVLVALWQLWHYRAKLHQSWSSLSKSFSQLNRIYLVLLVTLLVCAFGLFAERYAVNLIRYHEPSPDCSQVLDVQSCIQFSPWGRDYGLIQSKPSAANASNPPYIKAWLRGMWQRSFFAVSYIGNNLYDAQPPLPVPAVTVIVLGIIAALACLWYGLRILRQYPRWFFVLIPFGVYLAALFLQNYQRYQLTGVPVAINGRYLIPLMPVVILFAGLAFHKLFDGYASVKVFLAILVMALMLQGGGALTFILRSNEVWYWPNPIVVRVNDTAQHVLQPFVIGSREVNLFPIRP